MLVESVLKLPGERQDGFTKGDNVFFFLCLTLEFEIIQTYGKVAKIVQTIPIYSSLRFPKHFTPFVLSLSVDIIFFFLKCLREEGRMQGRVKGGRREVGWEAFFFLTF